MTKSFTSKEAKNLSKYYNELLNALKKASALEDSLKNNIIKVADEYIAQELLSILKSVPVDELNRDKRGIRVKALIDHGYTSMADLYSASVYSLASVRGISEDTAFTIKRLTKGYVQKTRAEIRIKLSSDNKNAKSTALVKAISVYKNSSQCIKQSEELLLKYNLYISNEILALKPATNRLQWLFSSKATKTKATDAYNNLTKLLNSGYKTHAENILISLKKLPNISENMAWADFSSNNVQFYNILEEINPGYLGNDDAMYGLPIDIAKEVQDECFFPDGLKCSLRRYQEWGVKYILHQERVLLGDEMGLGKTVQAIATMVSLKNVGATHFVVVCPASVITNWCREITKHSRLCAIKVYGSYKESALQSWMQTGGVAVTTYETTASFKLDKNFKFDLLIVDEAHYIKNPDANRSKNTRILCEHAKRLLFMTGTALENRVEEMISLISILQPKVAQQVQDLAFMSTAPQFRNKIAPVYYRRKREDVLTELPELIENEDWCSMTSEEEQIYEDAILEKHYTEARRVSWNIDDLENSSKANRLREIIEEAELEDRKVIVFSFFLDTIRKLSLFLGDRCLNPINGSVSPQRRQEIIDEFDKSPAGTVLLSQIQSGGTGLNIQSASVVVICEPQFKPSIENQAISRAYRMGQARNVIVHRLLCEDTIDEKITDLLKQKQAFFDAFADKSVAAQQSIEIDDKTFGDIIKEEIDRINEKRGIKPESSSINRNGDYYNSLMRMTYKQLVEHLLSKYGKAQYDYFINESCKSKNLKVLRAKEGLECHHIDEDKAIRLSNSQDALNNPFGYQKADRLVYCNYLEHLLLHIKIAEEPRNIHANKNELPGIGGAVNYIVKDLNGFYNNEISSHESKNIAASIVENDYDSYIFMLKRLWSIIKNNPEYNTLYSKEDLARNWDGIVITKIFKDLNST